MKHIITCISLLSGLALIAPSEAQAQAFAQGTTAINLGIGLGGARYSYLNAYNSDYRNSPTLIASFEHGVAAVNEIGAISVSGLFAIKSVAYQHSNQVGSWHYEDDRN